MTIKKAKINGQIYLDHLSTKINNINKNIENYNNTTIAEARQFLDDFTTTIITNRVVNTLNKPKSLVGCFIDWIKSLFNSQKTKSPKEDEAVIYERFKIKGGEKLAIYQQNLKQGVLELQEQKRQLQDIIEQRNEVNFDLGNINPINNSLFRPQNNMVIDQTNNIEPMSSDSETDIAIRQSQLEIDINTTLTLAVQTISVIDMTIDQQKMLQSQLSAFQDGTLNAFKQQIDIQKIKNH